MKFKNFPIKRVLAASLVVTLGFALNGCSKDTYNTTAPYGTISGNYATNGNTTLTNKQLYDMLRPNSYETFNTEIEEILLKNYLNVDFNTETDRTEMKDIILEYIFNTDEIQDVIDMDADDFDLIVEQFIDANYLSNDYLTTDDLKQDSTEGFTFTTKVFDLFKLDLAKQRYGYDMLKAQIAKGEEYTETDEDGEEFTVTNAYYISDKDIETYYNNSYIHSQDFNAVVVGFNTLAEYNAAMDVATTGKTFKANLEEIFISLYNSSFPYKEAVTSINDNAFTVNAETLSTYNTSLVSFVNNMEAGQYTTSYKEFGTKYYMVYKISNYVEEEWSDLIPDDFADLDYEERIALDANKGVNVGKVYEEIYTEIFDSKLTSTFITSKLTETLEDLIDEEKITIYDPALAIMFSNKYSTYTYDAQTLEDSNNIANIDGTKISVDSFFNTLVAYYGVEQSVKYFINCALGDSDYISKLTDDELEAAEADLDNVITNFEADGYMSYGITNVFTEEEFLSMMYGFGNQEDVYKYYYQANTALNYLTNDYDSDTYWALLALMGANNYNNYFSLDIKHVLLSVDYDNDGTLDDPDEFIGKLTTAQAAAFKQTIVNIYTAVYNEAQYLNGSISENLDTIVKNYNKDAAIVNTTTTENTWADVKTSAGTDFKIQMKVEDLGTVSNSNASTYVTEFSQHVKTKYDSLVKSFDDNETLDNPVTTSKNYVQDRLDQLEEYLDEEFLEKVTSYDTACKSVFGYHMLLSTAGGVPSSAIFTKDHDIKADKDDDYHTYENVEVFFDGEDEDATDTLNGYSTTVYPSLNQYKIYVSESQILSTGVENLKASTQNVISQFYSSFTSRYTNSSFKMYLAYTTLQIDIEFSDSTLNNNKLADVYFEVLVKTLDEYTDITSNDQLQTYAGWWEVFNDPSAYLAKLYPTQ